MEKFLARPKSNENIQVYLRTKFHISVHFIGTVKYSFQKCLVHENICLVIDEIYTVMLYAIPRK